VSTHLVRSDAGIENRNLSHVVFRWCKEVVLSRQSLGKHVSAQTAADVE
jgi:hypothetical protein